MRNKDLIALTILLLTVFSTTSLAQLQASPSLYAGSNKVLVEDVESILNNIFLIDMTKYHLYTIDYNGANTQNNITTENYLVMFKDNNNNTLITDVYVMHGRIIRLEIIGSPITDNYKQNTCLTIKHIGGEIILQPTTIKFIINNTIKWLEKTYGSLSQQVQEMLKNIESMIGTTKIVLSAKTGYEYRLNLTENYSFSLRIETNSRGDEAKELFISLWRILDLPLNITYMRSVIYMHYYIINNKLYCSMFSYNPLIPEARVVIPDKLREININTVISASKRIIEKYLERTGTGNYEILSIKPRWIEIKEYTRNSSLILVPGDNVILETKVKIGAEIKHYIIYLNLNTMDGFVKGEYIPIGRTAQSTATIIHGSGLQGAEDTVLVIIIVVLGVLIGLYLYFLRRKMTR